MVKIRTKSVLENNLIALLRSRSQRIGDRVGYKFIEDESAPVLDLTYSELDQKATAIATVLRRHCKRGDRALMMYHSGREFIPAFFGCLYAGVVAVPAYPPRKNHNVRRLLSIIDDAGINVVLSTGQIQSQVKAMDGYDLVLSQSSWINSDEVNEVCIEEPTFLREIVQGDDVMFLQYTSGSTGNPKGVMVTHNNIFANLAMLCEVLRVDEKSIYVSWLPYFHDLGLIGIILEALYAGVPAVLMSPTHFLQKPARWLRCISEYGGTVSGAPNFAYDLCVDKIKDEDLEGVDLSKWKVAFNGSEPVSTKTLNRFCNRFEKYGFKRGAFLPSFGMAEATLFVSGSLHAEGPQILNVSPKALQQGLVKQVNENVNSISLVSCGHTWHDHQVVIVNPVTKERCIDGQVGELWLKGRSVAKGYWNKPDQNKEIFEAYLNSPDDGPYLRTGDLAFLAKNELYITGRLKDLLIIRGRNYYPQDLELTAWESHPDLSSNNAAVFSIDTKVGTQLVIVQEVRRTAVRNLQPDQIFEAIVSNISAEYQLPIYDILLIMPGSILKTSSGKIQRQGNKHAYLNAEFKPIAQWRSPSGETESHQPARDAVYKHGSELHELQNWMRDRISELVGLPLSHISTDKDFNSFGLDSVRAIQLSEALRTYLNKDVPPGLIYDYPSIRLLAKHLVSINKNDESNSPFKSGENDTDIAIIGMSGRFPGAKDLEDFEALLFNGVNMITTPGVDAPTATDPRQVTYRAGYIPEVDLFDTGFFEIAPREAKAMDPQQRLLLELSYVAIQNAGYAPQALRGSNVGVFVGISNLDYAQLTLKHAQHKTAYFGTGVALSIAANRVSYFFDFKGPSLCIDTACSSSLVAVHQAVKSIRTGESTMALAGGVNLILSDNVNEYLNAGKLLAQDGHCKTFDAAADGYVRGEGAGVLLLKSKKQAIEDNDTILAIIKGSAVVQDGHSNGLLAPNGVSQQQVIQNALDDAHISPNAICYVEAHGTGTALGDPIEISALDQVFKTDRDQRDPLIVGSVKANIGHLESAAGIAGLIKTVICLRRKQVPQQVHFKKHNPNISWTDLCVKIPTAVLDLTANGLPLNAGVSSFGFGGTNAHVVLSEYVTDTLERVQEDMQPLPYQLVVLSGKNEEALTSQRASLLGYLQRSENLNLNDLSFSLATTRDHFTQRLAVKCSSVEELIDTLEQMEQTEGNHSSVVRTASGSSQDRKAFLFTGGGAQYTGMAEVLYTSQPIFSMAMNQCIAMANRFMDVDLKQVLFAKPGTPEETLLNRIDYMQPALFAYEYAMSKLWMSWGIMPDVLIGHSLGEIVAACVAGVFNLEDGIKLICSRGRLMQSLPAGGVMISLQASETEVKDAIANDMHLVSIAVINGPAQTVISGEKNAAERIKKIFDQRGVKTKTLQVSHASHSVLMDPILVEYGNVLASIRFRKPDFILISNVTGKEADTSITTPDYWIDHLRNTVRFSSGIKCLESIGIDTFIEIGPHPVLLGIARECVEENSNNNWLPSARSTDQNILYDSLARFYTTGGTVDWNIFYKGRSVQKITLPTYPFQRESYWIETTEFAQGQYHTNSGKPLLGHSVDVAGGVTVYESVLDLKNFNYLADHCVMGSVLVPAAFFCDMVQEYIASLKNGSWILEEILFEKPLVLAAGSMSRLQLHVQDEQDSCLQFAIYNNDAKQTESSWSVLAQGTIGLSEAGEEHPVKNINDFKKSYDDVWSVLEFYEDFAARGMEYGACFQSVEEIYKGKKGILGKIVLPPTLREAEITGCEIHPILLDGSFQLLNACVDDGIHPYLPFSVERYHLVKSVSGTLWAEVTNLDNDQSAEIKSATISLWNEQGEWVGSIQKLVVKKAMASLLSNQLRRDYQYHLEWKAIKPELKKTGQHINEKWLVIASDLTTDYIVALTEHLAQRGIEVECSDDWHSIASEVNVNKVLFFWNKAHSQNLDELAETNAVSGLTQLQALVALIEENKLTALNEYWWITTGVSPFSTEVDPSLNPVWGLGRVFIREHQDIPFKLLDVSAKDACIDTVASLADVLSSHIPENELALDKLQLYGLRLASGLYKEAIHTTGPRQLRFAESAGFESLSFDSSPKRKLGEMEVEIEVKYAGLNFRDIFRVLGVINQDTGALGGECAGVIVKVGALVDRFTVGDQVLALAEGTFANVVTTDHRLVIIKPNSLSFQQAATIPVAFLTAWYGLKNLANVKRNERVLIHSVAGGVGMAAIQIVHHLGGSVYGTASRSKWDDVRKLGVSHVYDSRTLDFYQQILKDTNGEGVDVVLNSFIDTFIDKSLGLLSSGGRFLEIGKRDIREASGVHAQHPGVTYAPYDLIYLMQHRQELIQEMFASLIPLFENNIFHPLPATSFAMQDAQHAFKFMSQAQHVGKVVLSILENSENIPFQLSPKSTILITGGLGGLALEVARYLVEKYNVAHLLLLGRREPSPEIKSEIQKLQQRGVLITTGSVDVTDRVALAEAIAAIPTEYPLKGVMHLAGLLEDAMILDQDPLRFARVMAPKIKGAWNLHELTKNNVLELFVLFSSAASVIGSVGQSNYASANAFMDGLALYRSRLGLPACAINWGPWESTGLVHRLGDEHKNRIKKQGIGLLSVEEGITLMSDVLERKLTQSILLPINKVKFGEIQKTTPVASLYKDLLGARKNESFKKDSGAWVKQIKSLNPSQRKQHLVETLQQEIAKVLSVHDAKKIHLEKSLQEFGMDSLMAVELRNRLSALVGKKLPVTLLFDYPNVLALAAFLDKQIEPNESESKDDTIRDTATGWRDVVYHQLISELKKAGHGDEIDRHKTTTILLDELQAMMGKVINREQLQDADGLDAMSLEQLENEFEKELKNI